MPVCCCACHLWCFVGKDTTVPLVAGARGATPLPLLNVCSRPCGLWTVGPLQAVSPDIFKAAETGNITELNAAMKAGMNVSVEDKVRANASLGCRCVGPSSL